MRRALRGFAVIAAGLLLTTGCAAGGAGAGGTAPSTNGIGPITLAVGKDNAGWLQGVITGWNKL
jgi:multiple sugar transport system substrate-binding protein